MWYIGNLSGRQVLQFTNNLSENAILPFAVGRKNWLFSNSVGGANASVVVYTMVEMAKAYSLNIYEYLKILLEHRPSKDITDEQLAELAPWSKKLQSIKNRMWIIVNCSNSQRTWVILYLTVLILSTYFQKKSASLNWTLLTSFFYLSYILALQLKVDI